MEKTIALLVTFLICAVGAGVLLGGVIPLLNDSGDNLPGLGELGSEQGKKVLIDNKQAVKSFNKFADVVERHAATDPGEHGCFIYPLGNWGVWGGIGWEFAFAGSQTNPESIFRLFTYDTLSRQGIPIQPVVVETRSVKGVGPCAVAGKTVDGMYPSRRFQRNWVLDTYLRRHYLYSSEYPQPCQKNCNTRGEYWDIKRGYYMNTHSNIGLSPYLQAELMDVGSGQPTIVDAQDTDGDAFTFGWLGEKINEKTTDELWERNMFTYPVLYVPKKGRVCFIPLEDDEEAQGVHADEEKVIESELDLKNLLERLGREKNSPFICKPKFVGQDQSVPIFDEFVKQLRACVGVVEDKLQRFAMQPFGVDEGGRIALQFRNQEDYGVALFDRNQNYERTVVVRQSELVTDVAVLGNAVFVVKDGRGLFRYDLEQNGESLVPLGEMIANLLGITLLPDPAVDYSDPLHIANYLTIKSIRSLSDNKLLVMLSTKEFASQQGVAYQLHGFIILDSAGNFVPEWVAQASVLFSSTSNTGGKLVHADGNGWVVLDGQKLVRWTMQGESEHVELPSGATDAAYKGVDLADQLLLWHILDGSIMREVSFRWGDTVASLGSALQLPVEKEQIIDMEFIEAYNKVYVFVWPNLENGQVTYLTGEPSTLVYAQGLPELERSECTVLLSDLHQNFMIEYRNLRGKQEGQFDLLYEPMKETVKSVSFSEVGVTSYGNLCVAKNGEISELAAQTGGLLQYALFEQGINRREFVVLPPSNLCVVET